MRGVRPRLVHVASLFAAARGKKDLSATAAGAAGAGAAVVAVVAVGAAGGAGAGAAAMVTMRLLRAEKHDNIIVLADCCLTKGLCSHCVGTVACYVC